MLDSLRASVEFLDARIRPIAEKPVAFADIPKFVSAMHHPLDDAGVRQEAERVMSDAVDFYARAGEAEREAVRDLFRRNRAFAWAATLPFAADDADGLRKHLIRFSIVDQGTDARDAVMWLSELCGKSTAIDADVVAAIRREVAALSSDVDRYGFGSTRKMMLQGYGGYGRYGAPEA